MPNSLNKKKFRTYVCKNTMADLFGHRLLESGNLKPYLLQVILISPLMSIFTQPPSEIVKLSSRPGCFLGYYMRCWEISILLMILCAWSKAEISWRSTCPPPSSFHCFKPGLLQSKDPRETGMRNIAISRNVCHWHGKWWTAHCMSLTST